MIVRALPHVQLESSPAAYFSSEYKRPSEPDNESRQPSFSKFYFGSHKARISSVLATPRTGARDFTNKETRLKEKEFEKISGSKKGGPRYNHVRRSLTNKPLVQAETSS
jgi:hypothetical protein